MASALPCAFELREWGRRLRRFRHLHLGAGKRRWRSSGPRRCRAPLRVWGGGLRERDWRPRVRTRCRRRVLAPRDVTWLPQRDWWAYGGDVHGRRVWVRLHSQRAMTPSAVDVSVDKERDVQQEAEPEQNRQHRDG